MISLSQKSITRLFWLIEILSLINIHSVCCKINLTLIFIHNNIKFYGFFLLCSVVTFFVFIKKIFFNSSLGILLIFIAIRQHKIVKINNPWRLVCFFITVIAFREEKRNYKENFGAGYKYSDYILLRDSRSGHCLQQLWGPVTPPDGPWSPVWRSRDLHPRSTDASGGFLFGSSTSSDTVPVSQTHRGHRGLLLTD